VSPPTKVATRFIQEFLVLAAIAIGKSLPLGAVR